MAAAVQTNLSVAFTHGAQLTMDHCGALIHGAAILWSCSLSQLPQETLLPCTPASQPLTPLRWELVSAATVGDTVAILLVSMLGIVVPDTREPGFYVPFQSSFGLCCSPKRTPFASGVCLKGTFECVHSRSCTHPCVACAHAWYWLKYMHADGVDRFSKVLGDCVGGKSVFEHVCVGVMELSCQWAYFQ